MFMPLSLHVTCYMLCIIICYMIYDDLYILYSKFTFNVLVYLINIIAHWHHWLP